MSVYGVGTRIFSHAVLLIISILTGYPLLWLLFSSLKGEGEFYSNLWWAPLKWEWTNYTEAWKISQLAVTYQNSVIVTAVTIVLVVLIAYLASYALARFEFTGNRIVMGMFLSALMVPHQVTLIPLFQVELFLGIYNTLWGLIFPYVAGGMPFTIFLLTTFIRSIPRELEEAAEMDGSSKLAILWTIVFPLTKPGLATIVILTFIGVWNEFFLALVMIKDPALRTIPVGMTYFNQVFSSVNYAQIFAAMSMSIIPVIIIFILFQKYFISGLTQGALKM
ncbi:carbohydrate ABC transporter permease [Paenibacillus piri]|uniref:Carbohydrate ABC transporter permease n=1 Tax=Paenibacillus piri TaxID=2547395 RepID=A0A4R5KHD8_9BACL|nr:carbohydrate ABC transporter permease [Paenibacillus piri]TDF94841.1 carbohydrate ABC transporter permease [Paenibacillus piri]